MLAFQCASLNRAPFGGRAASAASGKRRRAASCPCLKTHVAARWRLAGGGSVVVVKKQQAHGPSYIHAYCGGEGARARGREGARALAHPGMAPACSSHSQLGQLTLGLRPEESLSSSLSPLRSRLRAPPKQGRQGGGRGGRLDTHTKSSTRLVPDMRIWCDSVNQHAFEIVPNTFCRFMKTAHKKTITKKDPPCARARGAVHLGPQAAAAPWRPPRTLG